MRQYPLLLDCTRTEVSEVALYRLAALYVERNMPIYLSPNDGRCRSLSYSHDLTRRYFLPATLRATFSLRIAFPEEGGLVLYLN